jgi:hypothetical protein
MSNPTSAPRHATREQWLMAAYALLRPRFDELAELVKIAKSADPKFADLPDFTMPETVHISVGFGFGATRENEVILGQSWRKDRSADKVNHVFISPEIGHASTVLGVMIHEMLHVLFDCAKPHHGPMFAAFGQILGLEGKPTEMLPGPSFEMELMLLAESELGAYPHSALDVQRTKVIAKVDPLVPVPAGGQDWGYVGPAPQVNRQVRAFCPGCGYTLRASRKWLEVATPVCPNPACPNHLGDMTIG